MNDKEKTTIQISQGLKEQLWKLRKTSQETYEDTIKRLIEAIHA